MHGIYNNEKKWDSTHMIEQVRITLCDSQEHYVTCLIFARV